MVVRKIKDIKNEFHKHPEWLLIKVTKMDDGTTLPVSGQLLAHSTDRDTIYKKSLAHKGLIYIDHSSDKLPKGYAVAF